MASVVETLAQELERLLPLAKALAEVEKREAVAQRACRDAEAKRERVEKAAVDAQRSATEAITQAQIDVQEKTMAFKAELVTRHAELSRDYEALKAESKAARFREQEDVRSHKETLRDIQSAIGRARTEFTDIQSRLAQAKEAYAKALTGVTV
jgi:chromosome segregation ATPase